MSLAVEPAEPVRSVRSAEPVRTAIARDARAAGEFDRFLGDPRDAASVITIERSIDLDERSEFPHEPVAAVDAWGLQQYYVPEAHGGLLRDVLVPMMMIRRLASRDLTVAVAHRQVVPRRGRRVDRRRSHRADRWPTLVLSGDPVVVGPHRARPRLRPLEHGDDGLGRRSHRGRRREVADQQRRAAVAR